MNDCRQIIENQMIYLFLVPYIPVRKADEDKLVHIFGKYDTMHFGTSDPNKHFDLTFLHLISATNIIIKQLNMYFHHFIETKCFLIKVYKIHSQLFDLKTVNI